MDERQTAPTIESLKAKYTRQILTLWKLLESASTLRERKEINRRLYFNEYLLEVLERLESGQITIAE